MSLLVGLYHRFYFAKTRLDVSDKMVHIHPNCSPVDSVPGKIYIMYLMLNHVYMR